MNTDRIATSTTRTGLQTAPSVLILGARGRLGAAATGAFAASGWRVLAQARQRPQALPDGAVHLPVPLEDTAALAAAAAGAAAVVHAVNPPYTRWDAEALPLARAAMDVAERTGARFLLPGNVYNFGEAMPPLLSEDTPQAPTTRKGRIRVEIEAEMRRRSARGMRAAVIRAGDFFGGGTGSWLDLAVVKSLRAGKLVYPGPLDAAHAWAYLPDLARAFVAVAGARELPAFACLHFAGHTLTGAELLAAVERAAGALGLAPAKGWRRGAMPWRLIRAGGLVVPIWREIAEMEYLWRVPHALDGSAMRRAAGPLPSTPIDDAMREALLGLGFGGRGRASPANARAPDAAEVEAPGAPPQGRSA
jgi:nucleoside-diphosphate-sugar epimerase